MYYDPVCKNVLTPDQVKTTSTYRETNYKFCCEDCRDKFEQEPEKYIGRNWWQRFLFRLAESNAEEFKGEKLSCH
jgi:YHS domain-containing protein